MRVAPILCIPEVFSSSLCRDLIEGHRSGDARERAAVEIGGVAVKAFEPGHRKRIDWNIPSGPLQDRARQSLAQNLVREVFLGFSFKATRIERYLVGLYDGGYFKPHRDNTTPETAHRRLAVTINLNDGYEGGDLRFPDTGQHFRPEIGSAVVFSCSLLHEATESIGRRYAFLTFLYGEG